MKRMLAIGLVLALLCTLGFLIVEADHDCAGEDCGICALLGACLQTLQFLLLTSGVLAFRTLTRSGLQAIFAPRKTTDFSLITQKVKLSD